MSTTLRAATLDDRGEIREVAIESGLFTADDVDLVLDSFDSDDHSSGTSLWLVAVADRVQGVLYCAPEPAGDGVWNVLFLAVRPAAQGQGLGSLLLKEIADTLFAATRARLLLVETSSTASQEAARRLYAARGFTEVATIPDFYGDGDHKVMFVKTQQAWASNRAQDRASTI